MKPALLLIDLQQDFLAAAGLQPRAGRVTAAAARLLARARAQGLPVVHVWTTVRRGDDRRLPHWKKAGRWRCVEGTAGHRPPAALQPRDGETVVHKSGFNGFAGGELDRALTASQCDTVILAGVHLHACVRTLAIECLERGYQVRIADDAVASYDPIHAAVTRRWLSGRCVSFGPVSTILSEPASGAPATLVHKSPGRCSDTLFEVPIATHDAVAGAVDAASRAGPQWRLGSLNSRGRILTRVAEELEAAAPLFGRQMAVQLGKPISHALEEVQRTADSIRDVIRQAATIPLASRNAAGEVRHEPLGTVAVISPWNNPLAIALGKIAAALVYGNTVVWKPAPAALEISHAALALLRTCGVPADAVRLLAGDASTAQALAGHARIDAVTVTGSIRAGHALQEICAGSLTPLQAELNGNNAAIVWADADLRQAAAQVAWGAFGFAGQRCTANRRVIVASECYDAFMDELIAAGERLTWGDPLDPATDIGPLISPERRAEHLALLAQAQTDGGARRVHYLHAASASAPWVAAGAFVQAAIACCDLPDHPLVQEESMSPLLVVQAARDFEHAIELCNGVPQGLAAALFSRTADLQQVFRREVRAGILKFNTSTAGVDVTLPFGGWKKSGLGPPEHGAGDRLFYTRVQAVYGLP